MLQDQILLANQEQIKKRVQDLSRRSDDVKSRLAPTLKKLWQPSRPLGFIQDLTVFESLKKCFPNFLDVIKFVESTSIGLHRVGQPYECIPILLLGEPGLGKTLFASELAKSLKLPYYEISMATISASFALSGGNIQWAEGSIGFVAESLCDSDVANPVFMIDELDKANGSDRYKPINVLYSLLEPHSAKRFKDEALDIEINASRIIWIATGNDVSQIPVPILSRMRAFEIKRPQPEEMSWVITSIYERFRKSKPYGPSLSNEIPSDTFVMLSQMLPRDARMSIDIGALNAISANRSEILPCDIPTIRKERNRVGFY